MIEHNTIELGDVRLHYVEAAGPGPALLFIHGATGSHTTFLPFMPALAQHAHIYALDLRGHGRSLDGAPPHTVAACAADVVETIAASGLSVVALAGHSFGGKVVLTARAQLPATQQTWLLDSSPGTHPGGRPGTQAVVDMLATLPATFVDREAFEAAVRAAGQPTAIAQWLALSLRPTTVANEPRVLRFDVPMIRALMADYLTLDRHVERALREATEAAGVPTDIVFAHQAGEHGFVPMQQIAAAAGLGRLAPSHLLVHHALGPWLALRAVLVFDVDATVRDVVPAPPACDCSRGCQVALVHAQQARGDDAWRAWLAVRDACPLGADARYGDDQIAFHYAGVDTLLRRASLRERGPVSTLD